MSSIFDDTLTKVIGRMNLIEKALRNIPASLHSLYPVLSENSPAQLLANADNYAPGDYAVLRMSSDAARTVSGMSGGKKGRVLWIHNVGAQNIVLAHQSASSIAANRFTSPTAAAITLGANDSARLYYDSTSATWRITTVTV